MSKNGGNGSFRVIFPLVRLVSLLWGFNSSKFHFLNFFNDPRIIREQRIAAYKGYRGGDDVESLGAVLERLWCKVEVDGGGFGSCGVRGCLEQKEGHVSLILTKRRFKQVGELLQGV
ncbi:hypothetical protein Tco_0157920 [Tanacetum coccineum]